jgi:predicted metal-dependent enzyme (double-stranded beta helix superfamily)
MISPPLPAARDLVGEELAALATWLGDRPELWRPHVRHDPQQRIFRRLVDDAHVTVWLICWMPGHDTGFHDHDGSAGAVAVMQGQVTEERLRWAEEPVSAVYGPGDILNFGPADIHRVRHHGTEPAVTLHAYSPTLRRMGAYVADEHGRLLRHALDEDEELRAA